MSADPASAGLFAAAMAYVGGVMTVRAPRHYQYPSKVERDDAMQRAAFDSYFAEHAPDWFRPDAATMDRLAETYSLMREAEALVADVTPKLDRLVELAATAERAESDIAQSIPDAVWNATADMVDDIEVVSQVVGGEPLMDVLDLGEKLTDFADPPAPRPAAKPDASTSLFQGPPPGPDVGYPPEAVAGRSQGGLAHDVAPGRATEAVYWSQQARDDIAIHGVDWAEGHAEGLQVASSLASCSSELAEKATEVTGRPDPSAGYSAAWNRYENEAEAHIAAAPAPEPFEPDPGRVVELSLEAQNLDVLEAMAADRLHQAIADPYAALGVERPGPDCPIDPRAHEVATRLMAQQEAVRDLPVSPSSRTSRSSAPVKTAAKTLRRR